MRALYSIVDCMPAQDGTVKIPPNQPVQLSSSAANAGVVSDIGAVTNGLAATPGMVEPTSPEVTDAVAMLEQQVAQASGVDVSSTPTPAPADPTAAALPADMPPPQPDDPDRESQANEDGTFSNILEVLVQQGVLDPDMSNKVMVDHISTGESIVSLLEKNNVVSEEELTYAKATFHKVPYVNLDEVGVFPEAINQLPEGAARHYNMLPFAYDKENGTLSVAMKDPLDLAAIDFAQQKTSMRIVAHYAMPSVIERKIAEYYSQTLSSEVNAALEQTTQMAEAQQRKQDLSQLSGATIRQAPITKIVETIVSFAMKSRASDIHIEPLEDRTRVRYRIDGILGEKLILPASVHDAVVSRIKILSNLKIDEKRVPQDGRFDFENQGEQIDLRVSTLPTIHGEKIVMRLLKKNAQVPALTELGLTGLALRVVQDAIKVPHGIVLITGPTGSGKTTTLYSILHTINTPKVNIMTLEDPVEYQMQGVNQVQVNPQAGLTFASGLRSFLRQDPNIIMVGEIRDSETAELAIQASLTGHLVFSTLHTSSAAGALPRLMDMGAEPFLLASSMTMVAAQRVLRVINPEYKEQYKPPKEVIDDFQEVLGDRFTAWCKQKNVKPDEVMLYRSKKDRPQTEPEYKGRVAIFEVMKITEEIAKLILQRAPASDMEKVAIQQGTYLMKQDGYMKALEGLTTIEEVLRVAQI